MNDPNLWYVERLGLTRRIPHETEAELRRLGRLERWGHRATITRKPSDLVVVLKGAVDLNDGRHAKLVRLKHGDVFGDRGVEAAGEFLQAYDEATICRIDRGQFEAITHGELGSFGTSVGLRRRLNLHLPVSELLYRPSRARLARAFELLGEEFGQERDGGLWLPISLKPRHLADLTGIVPARTRRALERMQDDHLISVSKQGLFLPDFAAISAAALRWEAS